MPQTIHTLLIQYLSEVQKIYGAHLKSVILYGSYARGDYTPDSDIDIMRKTLIAMTGAFFAYIKVFVINTCTFFPSFS